MIYDKPYNEVPLVSTSFGEAARSAATGVPADYRSMGEIMMTSSPQEHESLRQYYENLWKAEAAEQQTRWERFQTGWKVDNLSSDLARIQEEMRIARREKQEEEFKALQEKAAKVQFELDQLPKPWNASEWDSAYNLGSGLSSMWDYMQAELAADAAVVLGFAGAGAVQGGIAAGAAGAVGGAVAGAVKGAGFVAGKTKYRAAKAGFDTAKAGIIYEMTRSREAGSLYGELLNDPTMTEEQRQAAASSYGHAAALVEAGAYFVGPESLLGKGAATVIGRGLRRVPAADRWIKTQAFKQAFKESAISKMSPAAQRLIAGGKVAAKAGAAVASEVIEEGLQRGQEISAIQQAKSGEEATVGTVFAGGVQKMTNLPVEFFEGKLSDESLAILEAMGQALLPAVVVGGVGSIMTASFEGSSVAPMNMGAPTGYEMNNTGLPQVVANAERNLKKADALIQLLGTEGSLQTVQKMVANSSLEGQVFAAPEDVEVLLALGEMSATAKNLLQSTGISKAIAAGRKTGTVEIPMQSFAEFVANEEIKESGVLPEVARSITFSSEQQSYAQVDRKLRKAKLKETAEKVKERASAKLSQKFAAVRKQMETAGWKPAEVEAAIDTFASWLGVLEDSTNGAVTAEQMAKTFKFNLEKRDFDIDSKEAAKVIEKVKADTRKRMGFYRTIIPKKGRNKDSILERLVSFDSKTVTAYAGSPSDYDRPLLRAIGTGEGHFAHGWGLYYALAFKTAERYRRRYLDDVITLEKDGKTWYIHPSTSNYFLNRAVNEGISTNGYYDGLRREIKDLLNNVGWYASQLELAVRMKHFRERGFDVLRLPYKEIRRQYGDLFENEEDLKSYVVKMFGKSQKDFDQTIATLSKSLEEAKKKIREYNASVPESLSKEIVDSIKELALRELEWLRNRRERRADGYRKAIEEADAVLKTNNYDDSERKFRKELRDEHATELSKVEHELVMIQKAKKQIDEGFLDDLKIKINANTGQTKKFTIRKIDTFLEEDELLWAQTGYVKKAINKMFESEPELANVRDAIFSKDNRDALINSWDTPAVAGRVAEKFLKDKKAKAEYYWYVEQIRGFAYDVYLGVRSVGSAKRDIYDTHRKRTKIDLDYAKATGASQTEFEEELARIDEMQKIADAVFDFVKEKRTKILKKQKGVSDAFVTAETMYDYMVNSFLGKEPYDFGGDYDKKTVHEAKKKASLMLRKYGINGITYNGHIDGECLVVFNPDIIRVTHSFFAETGDQTGPWQATDLFDVFDEGGGLRGDKLLFVAKHADITTFLHEITHFGFFGLLEAYNDGSLNEVWRKEMEKLYDYFHQIPAGRGVMAMHKDRKGKIIVEKEAHETIATGFQRYVEEGKAATRSLENLYAYLQTVEAPIVKALSRGYFRDRPLSDVQINFYDKVMQGHIDIINTEYKYGYAPLEQLPGVSDDEYEQYMIERRVARARSSNSMFRAQRDMVKNREKARWKEIYNEAFKAAKEALANEPEYVLIDYINDNGGLEETSFKAATRLASKVPQKYFSKVAGSGLTPEALIAKFGPEMTIVDIARTLAATPDLDVAAYKEARDEADTKYLQETEPVSDVVPANALRNILFVRSLVKESMMIKGEGLSGFDGHYKEWRTAAEEYVMGLTVKNAINLPKWGNMESRVTDDYVTALTSGDMDMASLKADQRAMVNYVLLRSKALLKQYNQFRKRNQRFYRAPTASELKSIDGVTWNLIHEILRLYGFTSRRGRLSTSAHQQMQDWIAARKGLKYFPAADFEAELDAVLTPVKQSSMTVQQFNRITNLIEKIRAVGEHEQHLFTQERQQRLDVVVGQMIENIFEMWEKKGDKAFEVYRKGSLDTYITPQLGMLEPLFGEIGMRELWVQLRDALVARDNLGDTVREMVSRSFIENNITALLNDKREFDVGGWTVNNSVLLFALQHSGNDHNRDNAIATLQQYYKDESFSEEDYIKFLNAAPKPMRNYVNDLWAMFGFLKAQIDQQTRQATGGIIGTVEATPYTLEDGTQMNGGYFPAPKTYIADKEVASVEKMYDNNLFFPGYGFTKDRIANKLGYLDMGQEALNRHIFQAVNFATTQVAFNDIQTVLNTPELQKALGRHAGTVKGYISDWVRSAIMPVAPSPRLLRSIQKMPTVVFLGFELMQGLVQLLGILPAASQVSTAEMAKSTSKLLNVPKYFKIKEEMGKRSLFMADRAKKFDSTYYGLMNDKTFFDKMIRKHGDGLVYAALSFVRTFQCMADMVVWDAAHNDALNSGLSVDDARKHADYIVQKTQGDRTQMNTPKGFEGLLRFFQPFTSYILTLRQMYKASVLGRKYKQLGALIALIALSTMLEAYLKENDKDWRRKYLGKKTKGSDRDFWKRVRNRWIAQNVSTFGGVALPFAGIGESVSFAATGPLLKALSDGYRPYTEGATPTSEALSKAVKAVTLDKNVLNDIYDTDMSLGANLIDFLI